MEVENSGKQIRNKLFIKHLLVFWYSDVSVSSHLLVFVGLHDGCDPLTDETCAQCSSGRLLKDVRGKSQFFKFESDPVSSHFVVIQDVLYEI